MKSTIASDIQEEQKKSDHMIQKSNVTFAYPLIENLNVQPQLPVQAPPTVYQPAAMAPTHFQPAPAPQNHHVHSAALLDGVSGFQAKVKRNSKCLKFWSYWFLASGVMAVFGNLMFLAVIDDFSTFTWYDTTGTAHTFSLDQSGMFVQAMIKIISGILLMKQATQSYATVIAVLKEYKEAESGRTRGVTMNERKSKKTLALKKLVGQVTAAVIFLAVIATAQGASWFEGEAGRFIDQYYLYNYEAETVNSTALNTTSLYSYGNETTEEPSEIGRIHHDEPATEEETNEVAPFGDFEDHDHELHHQNAELAPGHAKAHDHSKHHRNHNHESFSQDDESTKSYESYQYYSSCPVDQFMTQQDVLDWLSGVDKYAVKECLHTQTASWMAQSIFMLFLFFGGMQLYISSLCTKLAKNQKILEDKFMGPEIVAQVAPSAARNQVAVQQQQAVIQYIAVPQHFVQQYPAHVQPQNFSINRQNSVV